MEDIKQFMPQSLLARVSGTWPGFLASLIDEILYASDVRDVDIGSGIKVKQFTTYPNLYSHAKPSDAKGHFDTVKALVAARDFLEALAVADVASSGKWCGSMTKQRWESVKHKEQDCGQTKNSG